MDSPRRTGTTTVNSVRYTRSSRSAPWRHIELRSNTAPNAAGCCVRRGWPRSCSLPSKRKSARSRSFLGRAVYLKSVPMVTHCGHAMEKAAFLTRRNLSSACAIASHGQHRGHRHLRAARNRTQTLGPIFRAARPYNHDRQLRWRARTLLPRERAHTKHRRRASGQYRRLFHLRLGARGLRVR